MTPVYLTNGTHVVVQNLHKEDVEYLVALDQKGCAKIELIVRKHDSLRRIRARAVDIDRSFRKTLVPPESAPPPYAPVHYKGDR